MHAADTKSPEAAFDELLELLDRMAGTFFRLTAEQMEKDDLSPNRFNALRTLGGDEQLTMSALAERLKVSTAAVTSIVDKLETERFVRRVRSKEDRRQIFVQITSRGREAVQRILDVRADFIRYMFSNLSPTMQQNWIELYREFNRLLDQKSGGTEPPSPGVK